MNLQTSKNLGIFGVFIIFLDAILSGFTLIPTVPNISLYFIPRIIGIILILISLYHLANIYQTKTIYTNARNGATVAIIGTILNIPIVRILSPVMTNTTSLTPIAGLILQFTILVVFLTIAAYFVRRSLNELATKSGINDFTTAGNYLFIGAILTIVAFGLLVMGIAFLILANALSKMKNTNPTPPTQSTTTETSPPLPQTMPTTNTEIKAYCPYCGIHVPPGASFCTQCGKQL